MLFRAGAGHRPRDVTRYKIMTAWTSPTYYRENHDICTGIAVNVNICQSYQSNTGHPLTFGDASLLCVIV